MKKRIMIYGITIILGIIFAFFFYNNIEESLATVTDKNDTVTVFQLGVFKNIDNANNFKKNNPTTLIFKDNDYYRVYGFITINNLNLIEKYYQNNNIDYYEKKIVVNKELYDLILKYDHLITNEETLVASGNLVLKDFKSFYDNAN